VVEEEEKEEEEEEEEEKLSNHRFEEMSKYGRIDRLGREQDLCISAPSIPPPHTHINPKLERGRKEVGGVVCPCRGGHGRSTAMAPGPPSAAMPADVGVFLHGM
jgi:hypothetical protein